MDGPACSICPGCGNRTSGEADQLCCPHCYAPLHVPENFVRHQGSAFNSIPSHGFNAPPPPPSQPPPPLIYPQYHINLGGEMSPVAVPVRSGPQPSWIRAAAEPVKPPPLPPGPPPPLPSSTVIDRGIETVPGAPPPPPMVTVVIGAWQSQDPRTKEWLDYSPQHSQLLEAEYKKGSAVLNDLDLAGDPTKRFQIDFKALKQKNSTGGFRHIRRVEKAVQQPAPPQQHPDPSHAVIPPPPNVPPPPLPQPAAGGVVPLPPPLQPTVSSIDWSKMSIAADYEPPSDREGTMYWCPLDLFVQATGIPQFCAPVGDSNIVCSVDGASSNLLVRVISPPAAAGAPSTVKLIPSVPKRVQTTSKNQVADCAQGFFFFQLDEGRRSQFGTVVVRSVATGKPYAWSTNEKKYVEHVAAPLAPPGGELFPGFAPPPPFTPHQNVPYGSQVQPPGLGGADLKTSSSLFIQDEFHRLVADTVASHKGKGVFEDYICDSDKAHYEWESVFSGLKPRNWKKGAKHNGWSIFSTDPKTGNPLIRDDDVKQQELGDCWFISALAVVAHSHPQLIADLFVNKQINDEGVFGVKFWCDGEWKAVVVGPYFPVKYGGFKLAKCKNDDALWVPIIEKAYAKMHGSYKAIVSGMCDEAFYDLTGAPSHRIPLDPTTPDEVEELFLKLSGLSNHAFLLAASCGGNDATNSIAKSLNLETQHAYSLLNVAVCESTKRRMVLLRNPWGTSKQKGIQPPVVNGQQGTLNDMKPGSFWLDMAQFCGAFSLAIVCLTRNYLTGISLKPQCTAATSFLPVDPLSQVCCFRLTKRATVQTLLVQVSRRKRQLNVDRVYFDAMLLVLHVDPTTNEIRSRPFSYYGCDRVIRFEGKLDPGAYVLMPFSLQQEHCQCKHLVMNVMSEADPLTLIEEDWHRVIPQGTLMINRLFFYAVKQNHRAKENRQGSFTVICLRHGQGAIYICENHGNRTMKFHFDPSRGTGVYFQPFPHRKGIVERLIPANNAAVVSIGTVLPHGDGWSCSWGETWGLQDGSHTTEDPEVAKLPMIFQCFPMSQK